MAFVECSICPGKLQKLKHDFQSSSHSSAAASQSVEKELVEDDTTAPHSTSPPRVICSYQQHIADYDCLFIEEEEELTLGED